MTKLCKDCKYHVQAFTNTCRRTEKISWIDRVLGDDTFERTSCRDERSFWGGVFGGCGHNARYFEPKDE